MSDPLVRLRRVTRTYAGGTTALREVDLAVERHAFVSLLGPSGCGKSTALRLVAGLLRPSSGEVEVDASPRRGEIGFVFQEATLLPWATILDNVRLPLRLRGQPRGRSRDAAAEALSRVGLAGFERAYPRQLSGGMRMRVSIARALVTRPALLLMDEPFAALDEITRLRLNDDLLALWQTEAFTVLFVTHSVYESVYLSQRVLVMAPRPGRITADLAIPEAYPRDERFRMSEAYNASCRAVSTALRAAMAPA